jgi:hypothetical protein
MRVVITEQDSLDPLLIILLALIVSIPIMLELSLLL